MFTTLGAPPCIRPCDLGRYGEDGIFRSPGVRQTPYRPWRVGDDINKPTRSGADPSWNTIRGRYWKNRAAEPDAVKRYGEANVGRMKQGLAPQRANKNAPGGKKSMELSHEPVPRSNGGTKFKERWPCEHAAVDPYRRPGYCR